LQAFAGKEVIKMLTADLIDQFKTKIYAHYKSSGRTFVWREHITPYRVVVSEVMLQQTQTDRVTQKFDLFIEQFPDFLALASAPFDHVLRYWKGLGYNRRAQALQKIARCIVDQFDGQLPDDPKVLQTFPGLGPATASSIVAFAYNKPTVFIETNIRTVFIYTFLGELESLQGVCRGACPTTQLVSDASIIPLVAQTLDQENPRRWYYALMDYGVMLKKTVGNLNHLSAHYTKQSRFEGSDRQIRGKILQVLLDFPGISYDGMVAELGKAPERVARILDDLCREEFVCYRNKGLWLGK